MLKQAKLGVLRLAEATGVSRLIASSGWRRSRLLILCYHGVSMYDEHEWSGLYLSSETLRHRMDALAATRCNVLPLGEAVQRLHDGTLPERAVAITFDDGFHDFHSVAFPLIESYGFPVTLYLTTYYVEYNRPVFDPMCSYMLWRGRDRKLLTWADVLPEAIPLDEPGRERATRLIKQFALSRKLSAREKDDLLSQLAERLGLDYQDLCQKRIMHLMTPEEAKNVASRGADLQYHTHRHRVYRTRDRMFKELQDNLKRISTYTSREPRHFCYTGGFYLPEYPTFLKEFGMLSATTCDAGLCTNLTNPLMLPRLVDTPVLSDAEFRSWLAGTASLLPKRSNAAAEGQLLEEDPAGAN